MKGFRSMKIIIISLFMLGVVVAAVLYALLIHKANTDQTYYRCTTKAVCVYNQPKETYRFDFSQYAETNTVNIYCTRIGPPPTGKPDPYTVITENDLVVEVGNGGYIWEPLF